MKVKVNKILLIMKVEQKMKIREKNWQNSELILYNSFNFQFHRVSCVCFRFGVYSLFIL